MESDRSSVSANGRYVAFDSWASDLVPGDRNEDPDIFVRDLITGITTRVSVDTSGGDPNGGSAKPSISDNGRFVAYESTASNLVLGDGNGVSDIFVTDLVTGTTVRASVDTAGGDPNGDSENAAISGDGRYVAFHSGASDLVAGDNNDWGDIFVRDLAAGTTLRASVNTMGGDPNGNSFLPALSRTGRYVGFRSDASNLVADDGNAMEDVFVRDLAGGTTVRVSVDTAGGDSNGPSFDIDLSGSGRYAVFDSMATDLTSSGGDDKTDVFLRDLQTQQTQRVSVNTDGGDPDGYSSVPSISADGRYVAFTSDATDLIQGDGNEDFDVFRTDVRRGLTTRVSVETSGGDANGTSQWCSISADGKHVVFQSAASDLVEGDLNSTWDIYVRSGT